MSEQGAQEQSAREAWADESQPWRPHGSLEAAIAEYAEMWKRGDIVMARRWWGRVEDERDKAAAVVRAEERGRLARALEDELDKSIDSDRVAIRAILEDREQSFIGTIDSLIDWSANVARDALRDALDAPTHTPREETP